MSARHVVYCPAHAVPARLDGDLRVCQLGHRLTRWWVVDVHTWRVVDQVSEDAGVELELHRPLADCPRLAVEDVSLTQKERKIMPRGIKGSGPQAGAGAKKKGVVASARFEAGDTLLRIALVRHLTAGEASWRVTWEIRARGSKDSERGTSFAQPLDDSGETEVAARRAFEVAGKAALEDGWKRSLGGVGQRLVLKPVPAPPKGAVKKGSKAA